MGERRSKVSDDEEIYYDKHSNYKGKKTADGKFYDEHSNYLGRIDENGNFYDQHGNYKGKRQR